MRKIGFVWIVAFCSGLCAVCADAQEITKANNPLPLNDPAWVAIKAMTKKHGLNSIIDKLSDLGAKGIVVTEIRTCRL